MKTSLLFFLLFFCPFEVISYEIRLTLDFLYPDRTILRLGHTNAPMYIEEHVLPILYCPVPSDDSIQMVTWSHNRNGLLRFERDPTFNDLNFVTDKGFGIPLDTQLSTAEKLVLRKPEGNERNSLLGLYECNVVSKDATLNQTYGRILNIGSHAAVFLEENADLSKEPMQVKSGQSLHLLRDTQKDPKNNLKLRCMKDNAEFLSYTPEVGFTFNPMRGVGSFSMNLSSVDTLILDEINTKTSGNFTVEVQGPSGNASNYTVAINVTQCASNERQCYDGTCILERFWCDYVKHCSNADDERECAPPPCSNDQLHCLKYKFGSTYCYASNLKCDGHLDCVDGSDEVGCISVRGEAQEEPVPCVVATNQTCDGVYDCKDLSDETNCTEGHVACHLQQFKCDDKCINKDKVNDHKVDCKDGTDEAENDDKIAFLTFENKNPFIVDSGSILYLKCQLDHLKNITEVVWSIDGVPIAQFHNGTEELVTLNILPGIDLDLLNSYKYELVLNYVTENATGEFECTFTTEEGGRKMTSSFKRKVAVQQVSTTSCAEEQFSCEFSKECISTLLKCDNSEDCMDGSDEADCSELRVQVSPEDKCETWGICDQICESTGTSFTCICKQGYKIVNSKCSSSDTNNKMVLYIGLENRLLRIKNGHLEDQGRTAGLAGMDFHYKKNIIIWSDRIQKAVYSRDIDEEGLETRWTIPDMLVPGALAVDFIADNLYLIDTYGDQIYVFNLNTHKYAIILSSYTNTMSHGFRDIVLDPSNGYMFLLDSLGQLFRADMDGRRFKRLKNKIPLSSELGIDTALERVYLRSGTRRNIVEAISYDGMKENTIYKGGPREDASSPLTLFEDSLFWGDSSKRRIIKMNKFEGKENFTILTLGNYSDGNIISLKAVHPALQMYSKDINPCSAMANADCTDLCLLSPFLNKTLARVCFCYLGNEKELTKDKCSKRDYLLFTQDRFLRGEFLDTQSTTNISVNPMKCSNQSSYVDIDVDVKRGQVYIAVNSTQECTITRASSNLEDQMLFLDLGKDKVNKLAFNWVSDHLYYLNTEEGKISMIDTQDRSRRKVVLENLFRPNDLAIFPSKGCLFFSEKFPGKIYKAALDGSNVIDLEIPDLMEVTSIAVDVQNERLYWTDVGHKHIQYSNLDGTEIRTIVPKMIENPDTVILHDSKYILVTDKTKDVIVRMNKDDGSDEQEITHFETHPHVIKIFSLNNQPNIAINPCLTAGCSDICFLIPFGKDEVEAKCDCSKNLIIDNSDPTSCMQILGGVRSPDHEECSTSTSFCCDNHRQFNKSLKVECDGVDDCLDGSDEVNCQLQYIRGLFQCHDRKFFVGKHERCNNRKKCEDGSDEVNCKPCAKDEFQCWVDGKCISNSWVCDQEFDCLDKSDEANVTCNMTMMMTPGD